MAKKTIIDTALRERVRQMFWTIHDLMFELGIDLDQELEHGMTGPELSSNEAKRKRKQRPRIKSQSAIATNVKKASRRKGKGKKK